MVELGLLVVCCEEGGVWSDIPLILFEEGGEVCEDAGGVYCLDLSQH